VTLGGTSAPSSARVGTGSCRTEPALCWVTPAMLQGPQTLLHHLCWLTLPGWLSQIRGCQPAFSLRAFPASLFPPPPSWYPSSSLGWDQPASSCRDVTAAKLCTSPRWCWTGMDHSITSILKICSIRTIKELNA